MKPKGQHYQLETTPHEVEVNSSNLPSPPLGAKNLPIKEMKIKMRRKKGEGGVGALCLLSRRNKRDSN